MKIRPVETELFHAEGQKVRRTDRRDKIIVALRNFVNALKIRAFSLELKYGDGQADLIFLLGFLI
jgi:hypothetical protein